MAIIDSLKLRITPTNEPVQNLYNALTYAIIEVDKHTGQVYKDTIKQARKLSNDNNITSVEISRAKAQIKAETKSVIYVKLTSKIIKQRYFEGISIETLPIIVEYLNECLEPFGVSISIETLLNSEITDIDIARDMLLTLEERKAVIDLMKTWSIPSDRMDRGTRTFYDNRKRPTGFQFGRREYSTPEYPFLKTYDKHLDSTSKQHQTFFKHYDIPVPEGLQRLEGTIKNKAHLDKFNIGNQFRNILQLSPSELDGILAQIVDAHSPKNKTHTNRHKTMNNELLVEYILLRALDNQNAPEAEIKVLCEFISQVSEKSARRYELIAQKVHAELKNKQEFYAAETVKFDKRDAFLLRSEEFRA